MCAAPFPKRSETYWIWFDGCLLTVAVRAALSPEEVVWLMVERIEESSMSTPCRRVDLDIDSQALRKGLILQFEETLLALEFPSELCCNKILKKQELSS